MDDDFQDVHTALMNCKHERRKLACSFNRKLILTSIVLCTATCLAAIAIFFLSGYNVHTFAVNDIDCQPAAQTVSHAANQVTPRVLCMILTTPEKWQSKGRAVQNTWARRCFIRIFFYSASPGVSINEAVALPVPEGRGHLTAKVLAAFKYSFDNYSDRIDWYLKADDDTYVIWENLIEELMKYNSSTARYVGKTLPTHLPRGYNSGGAGYLLSKKALTYLLDAPPSKCKKDGGLEDVDIGDCLAKFGVYPENTLDADGMLKFNSDNPLKVMQGQNEGLTQAYYIRKGHVSFGNPGPNAERMFSPQTISFHYVEPEEMFMYEFLLNDLKRKDIGRSYACVLCSFIYMYNL
ncbi:hypothetical protein CAPTEDRAFT_219932 [Capitella teleta]|uniref:N-acetylgalactosaminide beta-1,3-galactosyltransferase n=1 Tax=Capitella teleta TaxID=283909 RepID=R7V5Z0_CAPTE|nr:hypothetical protein CAPTEDRAFT_219932 [Capitella teleta]|eukprot:ELU13999.1 hypothetical protein CAPTEDRAFT_219932 [Capitella teleta]